MSNEKQSAVAAWFAKNREQALALIGTHVAPKEVVAFNLGWSYPLDILTWLPLIGDIIAMRKKRFLLAMTSRELLIIRTRTFRLEEISSEKIPVSSIKQSAVCKFPFFCNLQIELTDGKTLLFKEMLYEGAAALKDAIDQAQGKPAALG